MTTNLRSHFDNSLLSEDYARCPRYAFWSHEKDGTGYVSTAPNIAANFGSAIHAGLAAHYIALKEGEAYGGPDPFKACADEHNQWFEGVDGVPDHYSLGNCLWLLKEYLEHYPADADYLRRPLVVEAGASMPLPMDSMEPAAVYTGRIDMIAMAVDGPVVADHKTTGWKVGILDKANPSNQLNGYLAIAATLFPDVARGMLNILYFKGKQREFFRPSTIRSEEALERWTVETIQRIREYWRCQESGIWPQSTFNCYLWMKQCAYHPLCTASATGDYHSIRVPTGMYRVNDWQPWEIKEALDETD